MVIMWLYSLGSSIRLGRLKLTSPTTGQVSLADEIRDAGKILDLEYGGTRSSLKGKSLCTKSISPKTGSPLKIQISSTMHRLFSKILVLNLLVKESATLMLLLVMNTLDLNMLVRKLYSKTQPHVA